VREHANNFSPINIHAPDHGRFPNFAQARPMQVRQGAAFARPIINHVMAWHPSSTVVHADTLT
jgi:hypothetical protein